MTKQTSTVPGIWGRVTHYVAGSMPVRFVRSSAKQIALKTQQYRYESWKRRNPSKQFKDYFSESVQSTLAAGTRHPTLGEHLAGDDFGVSGRGLFKRLVKQGLQPDQVCVDYGCGTLRIGVHLIEFLKPGAYWGLEISDYLLDEGRRLLGSQLLEEKKPELRVISPQAVAEAAAAKPSMLVSQSVLIHVHPDELAEYVGNVVTIIGSGGRAIITGKWSEADTVQFSGRSWVHSLSLIKDLLEKRGGKLTILNEEDWAYEGVPMQAKRGAFAITIPAGAG